MIKLTINGKAVEVPPGTSIIEAYRASGQDIAHYCWHPGLSVAGVCRLCMVEIEGNPRLQIACNTPVSEGMKVSNVSDKVKEAVKWGLDFHLINHPLDCPICDQAGECGLQDQYMQYGKYTPEMAERKVKKRKVIDLGPRVVLDSERCILCSRCVRFTEEVSKTNELGIFNRGDRSEIGTFKDRPLTNRYSVNTVDICPVGALTSKDFRFRQRVWFLKEADTICNGCSTGCNVKVSYNREGVFRLKPVFNKDVNGHWMCDDGRDVYKQVNRASRLLDAKVFKAGVEENLVPLLAARKVGETLRSEAAAKPGSVALVLTAQHSVEEYERIVSFFKADLKSAGVYTWTNNPESFDDFDGLLIRGDKNPNTKGLKEVLAKHGVATAWSELEAGLKSGSVETVVVAGPENLEVYPDLLAKIGLLSSAKRLIWATSARVEALEKLANVTLIPLKTYMEKSGTFVNHAGLRQQVKKVLTVVPNALSLVELTNAFAGQDVRYESADDVIGQGRVNNIATAQRGAL